MKAKNSKNGTSILRHSKRLFDWADVFAESNMECAETNSDQKTCK